MSVNSDIQASHNIIKFLEDAKSQAEIVLDALPGILAVVDVEGKILRGNFTLAKIIGVDHEGVLGSDLLSLFDVEQRKKFADKLRETDQAQAVAVEFELDIGASPETTLSFLWHIRPLRVPNMPSSNLLVVTGHDLTEVKRVNSQLTHIQHELQTAKTVQDTLFAEFKANMAEAAISGFYKSATECGGDWWFHNRIGDKIFLWIGDVTGHGVAAALVTSAARAAVSIIESMPDVTPRKALDILNKAVIASAKGQKLMSFFVASVDLNSGLCTYANAGHEYPILLRKKDDGSVEELDISFLLSPPTPLLGVKEDSIFMEQAIHLGRGDKLFFYTDGLLDVKTPTTRSSINQRISKIIKKAQADKTNYSIVESFCSEVERYCVENSLIDDVTFFIFEMNK